METDLIYTTGQDSDFSQDISLKFSESNQLKYFVADQSRYRKIKIITAKLGTKNTHYCKNSLRLAIK